MSQEELAYRVGVSQAYIAMLEQPTITRKKSPKLSLISAIALALGVCPNKIMKFNCENCSLNNKCDEKEDETHLNYYI
jgi:predicted transcriptional regulator